MSTLQDVMSLLGKATQPETRITFYLTDPNRCPPALCVEIEACSDNKRYVMQRMYAKVDIAYQHQTTHDVMLERFIEYAVGKLDNQISRDAEEATTKG